MSRAREDWLGSELGVEPGEDLLGRLGEVQGRLVEAALEAGTGTHEGHVRANPLEGDAAQLSQELERAQDRLREARHRLRNQLHSVVATLSAQQAAELSPQTRKALQSSIARVAAITVVNDLLTSDLSAEIPLLGTLEVLARQLVSQMGAEGRLRVRGEGQGLALEGRRAAAAAMLAAELVANAVEHGFWGNRRGMVAVRLDMEQELGVLEVCDDGCGFPPGFDPHRSGGLGWRLVTRMVRRDLGGEVTVENGAGARVRVEFPVESGASSGERKR